MKTHYNKSLALLSLLISSLLVLSACSSNKMTVKSEFRSSEFNTFKTYRWYEKSGFDKKGEISEITYDYITQSVDKELSEKQLSKMASGNVDFYVNVHISAEVQVDIKNYQVYSGVGEGYTFNTDDGFNTTLESKTQSDIVYYREGTLLIDIIDPASDKLIWRGTASKRFPKTPNLSQQERETKINKAVSAVLANFPPK